MPDPNIVRINNVPYSWTSCAFFFNGLPYKGLKAANWKETREVKLVHAAQQDGTPLGNTSGRYKIENLSFTLLRDSANGLLIDLTALGLGSFGDAEFPFLMQTFEPTVPPRLPATTLITGCRITGIEEKQEEGTDELVTEISCAALLVFHTIAGVPAVLWSQTRTLLP